jgi:hypothetical protein
VFNGLISKSVIRDNINILIPHTLLKPDILILISHGSGGTGDAELNAATFFLARGYKVGLIDYFTKWGIDKLWWCYQKGCIDEHSVSFEQMLTDHQFPYEDRIIHIGFSLGGTFGLLNAERFEKNFCFYPGIIGITEKLVSKDYSNTTVFVAELDNWCDNYNDFELLVARPPTRINVTGHHGFMIPNKDKLFDGAKYNIPSIIMSQDEFSCIRPSHSYLSSKYGYTEEKIRLKYNEESCILCLSYIESNS